jgi:hypothetical protein
LKLIIDELSVFIHEWAVENTDASPENTVKSWGFAELVKREAKGKKESTQPIPMTINGTPDRVKISLDDRLNFISWIRWIAPVQTFEDPDDGWGLRIRRRKRIPLRVVVAHKVELGEDLIFDLARSLPGKLMLSGYEFVYIDQYSIDPDHETIYRTELGETVYEKHRFPWNLYVINVDIICSDSKCEFIPSDDAWVLSTGTWNDAEYWQDDAIWQDLPV